MTVQPGLGAAHGFRVVRELGRGGMGVVYEVEGGDGERHLALKALQHVAPEAIYRLKREFRAVAELSHPNVISLYELFVDGDDCYFTMELVDGVDILTWLGVRDQHAEVPPDEVTPYLRSAEKMGSGPAIPAVVRTSRLPLPCDLARVRPAFRQLALGIDAVHRAGLVHRDIKPSNVMIDRNGTVRVLDLGLVANALGGHEWRTDQIAGTVAYMAPEATAGAPATPAQDWYSFGIVLYQALTGLLPFGGSLAQVVSAKLTSSPPPPRALVRGVPADLDELCRRLLVPEPGDRPGGPEILERFAVAAAPTRDSATRLRRPSAMPFAGRTAELAQLTAALDRVKAGTPAIVHIRGRSGIGKSELVHEFLRQARDAEPRLIALEGRCYPHERVTYRAIDPLIDHLSRLWASLPEGEAHRLLPRRPASLVRLFPILARVAIIDAASDGGPPIPVDEERGRGHAALREVLQRLADRGPLVLVLDDVHLLDASTVDLLVDVLQEPDAPVALLLLISWSDATQAATASPGKADETLLGRLVRELGARIEPLDLQPLSRADAVALAGQVLGGTPASIDLHKLARESRGLPFFVIELAHFAADHVDVDLATVKVERVIAERIAELPAVGRVLLEVVTVAGAPTPCRIAAAAAHLDPDDEVRQLRALRASGLVRIEEVGDEQTVEPYHDRIRRAVRAELSDDEVAARHRALAVAYEDGSVAAADRLALHWLGAGEPERACRHALRAAAAADAELDFAGAATFYRIALDHGQLAGAERVAVLVALGDAAARIGQPREAARAQLEAADLSAPVDGLRLRSHAASTLLRGGYLDAGVAEIERVLAALGMRLAPTPRRAMLELIWARLRLRLRGTRFTLRPADQLDPMDLVRVDACYAVGSGLSMVDLLRATAYHTRCLLHALDLGEPERLGRAMFLEAGSRATRGDRAGALELIAKVRALEAPLSAAWSQLSEAALAALVDGDWPVAVAKLEGTMAALRDAGHAAGWEHGTCQIYRLYCLFWMGELAEVNRSLRRYVQEARRRGDLYALANVRCRNNTIWLAADDPVRAAAELEDAYASWPRLYPCYRFQDYFALIARVDIALYTGHPEEAARRLGEDRPLLRRAHLLRIVSVALNLGVAEARTSVALAARGDRAAAAAARRHIKTLARLQPLVAQPLARLFDGLLADLCGDRATAVRALGEARAALAARHCVLYAAAAAWRLGEVQGDPALIAAARAELIAREVRSPERLVRLLAPSRD